MERLLEAVTAVVCLVSPEKVRALAGRIRKVEDVKTNVALSDVVGTATARAVVDRLVDAWRATSLGSDELASMLLAAGHAFENVSKHQSTELVWTGPTTPFVSARRTEQVLLEVVNGARHSLFITSYVAYDIANVVRALNNATARRVQLNMLLERPRSDGGSISFDALGKLRHAVPDAHFFTWGDDAAAAMGGSVHAKVVVADDERCFITSANLTGSAMERNMEAGVLISGGEVPKLLASHLRALVDTKIVVRA